MMNRRTFIAGITLAVFATPLAAEAQPAAKVYRVGVVLEGGLYYAAVDGLRDGLKELGFDEGTHYNLHIRDVKGNLTAVGETAKNLERERIDLIYSVATGVSVAVQRATTKVPIVFYAGVDPVAVGLVKSLARPGVGSRCSASCTTAFLWSVFSSGEAESPGRSTPIFFGVSVRKAGARWS